MQFLFFLPASCQVTVLPIRRSRHCGTAMAWYDEPKYNRTLSSAGYLLFCLLYVVASVLPFLMLAFAAGVALGLFSGRVLLVMA